ncbi:hypothetical protein ACX93W_01760 [Paenibacillus sp. CAU 1782]
MVKKIYYGALNGVMAAGLIFAAAIGLAALVTAALSSDYSWPARSFAIVMLCGSAAVGITYEFVGKRKEAETVDEA